MTRVLIADDHAIVRKGLVQILAESPEEFIVDEAHDGADALAKAAATKYDLVLVDISMPGRGGLDVLKELKVRLPSVPVLVLSIHPEEQYAVRALKAGASGYVTKDTAEQELLAAIGKVRQGGRYVSPSLAETLAGLVGDPDRPRHAALSDREYQILSLLASGKTSSAIALELSLSVKTISTYRIRLLKKMNMKNNAQLTHYFIRTIGLD
ncbi:MAG TPA: response regulator transcription factor [Verrucomicrobiae bacterium]|nr:response regulator transcription factor [Verrucomicrobiae bacterium]